MNLEKSQKIFIIFCIFLGIYLGSIPAAPYQEDKVTDKYLASLPLKDVERIMFVAHPDDESLWGGAHLAQNKYLVVCLTNATSYHYRRYWEFKNAMKITNTPNMILDYPDFQHGHRIDWAPYEKDIQRDVQKLLAYKNWKEVVTHNPYGEYGHQHHMGTSDIVTHVANRDGFSKRLFYFGLYYKDPATLPVMQPENAHWMLQKQKMFLPYHRERNTIKKHQLMHPYEQWIRAADWKKVITNNKNPKAI